MGKNAKGSIYVDFERIRKVDGYVFYWQLGDFLEPAEGFCRSQCIDNLIVICFGLRL